MSYYQDRVDKITSDVIHNGYLRAVAIHVDYCMLNAERAKTGAEKHDYLMWAAGGLMPTKGQFFGHRDNQVRAFVNEMQTDVLTAIEKNLSHMVHEDALSVVECNAVLERLKFVL